MKTMISIIIPVYNKSNYIANTLQSVIDQTYKDWEAIVIDDGSTDNSAKIIRTITDSRIHFYQQDNHGVSYTRNRGIHLAKGDYIALLDADDEWFPDYLETMMELVTKYPDYAVFCVAQKDRPIHTLPDGVTIVTEYCTYPYIFWTGSMLIKKEVYNNIGDFMNNIQLGEDNDMWLRISCKYHTVYLNEAHVSHPYFTENNLGHTFNKNKTFPFWIWYKYDYPNKKKLFRYVTDELVHFGNLFAKQGDYDYAWKLLYKSRGYTAISPRLKLLYRIIFKK